MTSRSALNSTKEMFIIAQGKSLSFLARLFGIKRKWFESDKHLKNRLFEKVNKMGGYTNK